MHVSPFPVISHALSYLIFSHLYKATITPLAYLFAPCESHEDKGFDYGITVLSAPTMTDTELASNHHLLKKLIIYKKSIHEQKRAKFLLHSSLQQH